MKFSIKFLIVAVMLTGVLGLRPARSAQEYQTRIEQLEAKQKKLKGELKLLKDYMVDNQSVSGESSQNQQTHFGGYGEIHYNDAQGNDADYADIHRLVFSLGYDFNDWIRWNSELEVEHAYVNKGNGYLLLEQGYLDFLLSPSYNFRAGRVLVPVGIINKNHEPPTFNGVERPSMDKYVIPSTWSGDGAGFFGKVTDSISYEGYLVNGLDGSAISPTEGFRDSRLKERPGYKDPAVTGRLDYRNMINQEVDLRTGASFYTGGLNNGNKGDNPGLDADIQVLSLDFDLRYDNFDFRGEIVSSDLNGIDTTSQIQGYYLEAGVHYLPAFLSQGKLKNADAVYFVRYENFDTQKEVPVGTTKEPAASRDEVTFGVSFYPKENVVLKADLQVMDDARSGSRNDQFNVGLGWNF